jgi:hypothetical protein
MAADNRLTLWPFLNGRDGVVNSVEELLGSSW